MPKLGSFTWVAALGAALAVSAQAAPVRAEGALAAELSRYANEAPAARGPEAYAALRSIQSLWDLVDPEKIEPALEDAASRASAPATRVYAELLLAEARSRRGDFDGAAQRMGSVGLVDKWLFVGPFDDENRIGLATPYQPELELNDPIVFGRAFDGKERAVRWRAVPPERRSMVLDLGDWVRPREEVCAYATTVVKKRDPKSTASKATVWVGVEGAFRMWWDGEKVLEDTAYRGFDFDRSAATVEVGSGTHRLTVKVCSDSVSPKLAVRLGDEKGGKSDAFEAVADPALFQGTPEAAPKKPAAGSVLGPIQAFEKLTSGASPRAADLEAYARYLKLTRGNPRGEHKARDLARRAAETEPTWQRLLLAAELAEDRNQARGYVDKAQSSVRAGDEEGKVAVLLMQARVARTGINWRDAIPYFDKALAIDPANAVATRANMS